MASETVDISHKTFVGFDALCSSLDNQGLRPLVVTGALKTILINHFSDENSIQDPDLKHAIWDILPNRSKINIDSVYRWNPDEAERGLGIYIKRNSMKKSTLYMADLFGATKENDREFSGIWIGSHTLFCVGANPAQAEILGTEVLQELEQFSPVIRDTLRMVRFRVAEIGALGQLDRRDKRYVVPITVSWAYGVSWVLRQQARPLDKLDVSLIFMN